MPRKLWVPVVAVGLALGAIVIPAVQSSPATTRAMTVAPAVKGQPADVRVTDSADRPAEEVAFHFVMRKAGGKDERKAGRVAATMVERKAG